MKIYKSSTGSLGYYKDGFLHTSSYMTSVKKEDLIEATKLETQQYYKEKQEYENRVKENKIQEEKEAKKIEGIFGFDPRQVGNRPRGFFILDEDSDRINAKKGDLCICARDGGSNPPDCMAGSFPNFIGTVVDEFDCTYRYYYYKHPIKDSK